MCKLRSQGWRPDITGVIIHICDEARQRTVDVLADDGIYKRIWVEYVEIIDATND